LDRALFTQALDQFYEGQPDNTTLALLRQDRATRLE
jgi:uncharacterized protein (DUF1810 family)